MTTCLSKLIHTNCNLPRVRPIRLSQLVVPRGAYGNSPAFSARFEQSNIFLEPSVLYFRLFCYVLVDARRTNKSCPLFTTSHNRVIQTLNLYVTSTPHLHIAGIANEFVFISNRRMSSMVRQKCEESIYVLLLHRRRPF